ncbi:MAG: N-acetylneuraminate synthase family protein [Elusimicrobiota bacterium]|jgi:sialic acid synthase SpsE
MTSKNPPSIQLHAPALPDLPPAIEIGKRAVGPGHPCYIIAEAGSNHDRDLKKALSLVDAAAEAGCDAVKFQTFRGDDIASDWRGEETRLPAKFSRWGSSLQELYRACALPDEFHEPLAQRARKRGIHFFSSPFSEAAVDRLAKLGVPALKIASFELVHLPLIRRAASTGLPLILSTGMAGLGDVERALDAAVQAGARRLCLLHCGSNYPLSMAGAHLSAMETLRRAFGVPVGYSDHTLGMAVPVAAATLGANVLEKHFTLDRRGDGPDHAFALEPAELRSMVEMMRAAEQAVGSSRKRRVPEEEPHARRGRRSLFTVHALKTGAVLGPTDVKVVRPGIGLEPLLIDLLLGRRLVRNVAADTPLRWEDFLKGSGA